MNAKLAKKLAENNARSDLLDRQRKRVMELCPAGISSVGVMKRKKDKLKRESLYNALHGNGQSSSNSEPSKSNTFTPVVMVPSAPYASPPPPTAPLAPSHRGDHVLRHSLSLPVIGVRVY